MKSEQQQQRGLKRENAPAPIITRRTSPSTPTTIKSEVPPVQELQRRRSSPPLPLPQQPVDDYIPPSNRGMYITADQSIASQQHLVLPTRLRSGNRRIMPTPPTIPINFSEARDLQEARSIDASRGRSRRRLSNDTISRPPRRRRLNADRSIAEQTNLIRGPVSSGVQTRSSIGTIETALASADSSSSSGSSIYVTPPSSASRSGRMTADAEIIQQDLVIGSLNSGVQTRSASAGAPQTVIAGPAGARQTADQSIVNQASAIIGSPTLGVQTRRSQAASAIAPSVSNTPTINDAPRQQRQTADRAIAAQQSAVIASTSSGRVTRSKARGNKKNS